MGTVFKQNWEPDQCSTSALGVDSVESVKTEMTKCVFDSVKRTFVGGQTNGRRRGMRRVGGWNSNSRRVKGVTDRTQQRTKFTDHCRLTGPWWLSMKNLIHDSQQWWWSSKLYIVRPCLVITIKTFENAIYRCAQPNGVFGAGEQHDYRIQDIITSRWTPRLNTHRNIIHASPSNYKYTFRVTHLARHNARKNNF